MERLFGYEPGTFQGIRRLHESSSLARRIESPWRKRSRSRRDQGVYHQRFRILLLNGNQRWIASNGQFFYDEDGHAVRMRGISLDITDQVRAETQRRVLADRFRLVALATNGRAIRVGTS
ncbi:MAG: PAS domain-containing protein [Planctomycetota bacterium]